MSAESPLTRRDLEARLIVKAWKDPEFKKAVTADPKGLVEKHFGHRLPEQMRIFVHEEDGDTLHFSIPPMPATTELSDEELEQVSGGTEVITTAVVTIAIGAAVTAAGAGAIVGATIYGSKTW